MRKLRFGAIQMFGAPAPVPERLARAEKLVADLAGRGAEVIVLPEVFNTGYEYAEANYGRAERLDGPSVTWMRQAAARHGVYLAGTLMLLDLEDIYNAMLLVAPDGHIWRYNKCYPWVWERAYFRGDEAITVADTPLGRFGMLVCWDVAHADLWARYAGRVDAMLVSSSPPAMGDVTYVFPDGERVEGVPFLAMLPGLKAAAEALLCRELLRQAAWLGVPAVNTTATGLFASALPLPRLSLATCLSARPDLWRQIEHAQTVRLEARYYNYTYVADAAGRVLAQAAPETESGVVAEAALAEQPPQPAGPPPASEMPALAFAGEILASVPLAEAYRAGVRRALGTRMAPVRRSTRLWLGALGAAGLAGYLLGRARRRR